MEVNAKRAFELLNKLSFERVSCTAEETRTAEALLAEIDSFTWARSDIQRVAYITITVHFIPDIRVVFWGYPITWMLSSVCFTLYYFKGDWMHNFERLDARRNAAANRN